MTEMDHEKEFEAYLSRRAGLRAGVGDGNGLEPPEELDRIVLTRARQAIRLPRRTQFYRSSRWALPMGLAATVVLTFTVMLHFGLLPKPIKEEVTAMEATVIENRDTLQSDIPPESKPLVSPSANIDIPMPTRQISESERAEPTLRKREILERLRMDRVTATRAPSVPVAAPAAPIEADQSTEVASSTADEARRSDTAQAADSGESSSAAGAQARREEAYSRIATPPEDPSKWLKRIDSLRAQGKIEEADRELLAFRKAWPDYPVTDDRKP